jgi:hypothetical protein
LVVSSSGEVFLGEFVMFNRALFVVPALGLGIVALVGCSASVPAGAPAPTVSSTSSSSAAPTSAAVQEEKPVVVQSNCAVNPADVPVPPADPYTTLPAKYGVQMKITGVPDVVKVGKPVEAEVTLCNNSPVAYPEVGVVFMMDRCGCAQGPLHLSRGTVQRFDAAGGSWVDLEHSSVGTGMDYLSAFSNQQPLPKGKSVTVRYRFTFDRNTGEGEGGVIAAVVTTDGPMKISETRAGFAVRH